MVKFLLTRAELQSCVHTRGLRLKGLWWTTGRSFFRLDSQGGERAGPGTAVRVPSEENTILEGDVRKSYYLGRKK
jgi:hypothetical protein